MIKTVKTAISEAYDAPSLRITAMSGRHCLCSSPLSGTTETMTFGDTTGWYDGTETLQNGGSLTIFN